MASPSRFTKVGLQGRKDTSENSQDSYLQTFEFPVVAVASASAQDTGVAAPAKALQVVSAMIYVNTAEVTAATKTVTVGVTADGDAILTATDTSATGPIGTPITAAISGGGNFTYTLAGADFAELDAVCVVTVLCID